MILTKNQGLLASENWTMGQNDRTGKTGLVPTACLYAIPTLVKPSAKLLVCCMLTSAQLRHCVPAWGSQPGAASLGSNSAACTTPQRGLGEPPGTRELYQFL